MASLDKISLILLLSPTMSALKPESARPVEMQISPEWTDIERRQVIAVLAQKILEIPRLPEIGKNLNPTFDQIHLLSEMIIKISRLNSESLELIKPQILKAINS